MRVAVRDLLKALRVCVCLLCFITVFVLQPDAIGLVDAFDFTDYDLNSALGCYDGKVFFVALCFFVS